MFVYRNAHWNNRFCLPPETGTAVIKPKVTNILYVTAELNCINIWKTVKKLIKTNEYFLFYFDIIWDNG